MDYGAIRRTFQLTQHCMLGTASTAGVPWLSTVFFNYDASFDLVWESLRDARHSRLIDINPHVAVYIESEGIAGALYASGSARQVEPASLDERLALFLDGPHQREDPRRTVRDYDKDGPLGLYEARLDELFLLKRIRRDGYEVEEREDVDLEELRGLSR